jgi:regulator of cell morphogenesis and NO signaling
MEDSRNSGPQDWTAQPLDELCEAILERHHAHAHVAVPRLRGHLAALVEREPGALPVALPAAFAELADRLQSHLAKEENILFPALATMAEAERNGRGRPPMPFPTVLHPIRLMESEHAGLADGLERVKALASGFVPPDGASASTRRLLEDLAAFCDDLAAHLQVENDVLFPRALELDRRL